MSELERLIQELCPLGVKYVKIGDVAEVGTGSSNGNEATDNGEFPFFVRSQTVKAKNDYEYDEEAIIIPGEGGIGDIFHYINGKYALHQRVYRIHFLTDEVNVKFAHYYMQAHFKAFIMQKAVSSTVTSIRKPMVTGFTIPVPPLEVQREIVCILDNFTELTAELAAELAAELTARKKQYEHYRRALIENAVDLQTHSLGDLATIKTGNKPEEILDIPTEYEYINAGTSNSGYTKRSNCSGDTVTTPSRGQGGIGFVGYQKQPFWLGPLCYRIQSKDSNIVLNRYLYHYLTCFNEKILAFKKEGGTPAVNASDLMGITIDVPPIFEQNRINEILDRFDTLCNDISAGLPAEIEARQKQYEYYRDKLLTFQEMSV